MKDIARDLGVSVATVSRALKDSSRISTAQKERIQKYAREHNFFPNFLGEALRHNKVKPMKVIGVIVPQVVHYYFMSVLSGIEEEARARGYRVMVAQSNERYDKEVPSVKTSIRTRFVASSFRRRRIPSSMTISKNCCRMGCRSSSMIEYVRA